MVPAINPEDYLKPQREKHRIKAKQFSDYQCSNIVEKNVTNNSRTIFTVVIPLRQFGSRHPLRCYSKITFK